MSSHEGQHGEASGLVRRKREQGAATGKNLSSGFRRKVPERQVKLVRIDQFEQFPWALRQRSSPSLTWYLALG